MNKFLKLSLEAILIVCVSIFICLNNINAQINQPLWSNLPDGSFISKGERRIIPLKYNVVKTDFNQLRMILNNAHIELSEPALNSTYIIELPLPTGELSRFILSEYSMMEPALAQLFPEIKTYNIKGIDDPYATGKLDITVAGFHAMILTPQGDFFIDPYSTENTEIYISYFKTELINKGQFECFTSDKLANKDFINNNFDFINTGQQLRTYRLAVGATGEYTSFHGGTVTAGMNAIVTAINRLNGVYERDLSVRMTLVANNNLIVYTNATTDPYTNSDGGAMLSQNQSTVDNFIGQSNYDIGHVFSTGGGGVAYLGVVCVNGFKAGGVTGLPSPIGDPFYIDFVAHEIGHQYGGSHTFNSIMINCNGNRNSSTAWEPGSGTTIMAYAGICGGDNLQSNSDAYFHTGSVSEITNYTQLGSGNSCPVITSTGNTPPSVTVPTGGFTIPISTPFQLTGSATDLENPSSLTYCWEEFDLGPAGSPNTPSGNAPIFRSFLPVTTSTRTFPRLSNLLNNTQTIGERLPTYTRNLSFRLTVRDNNIGGGGINFNSTQFSVTSTAGPFLVTQPNTSVTWNSNPRTVTWNVANTNVTPVNCQFVNIKLSSDGGFTFPIILSSNTANDGSEVVTLPAMVTSQARIKVESVGNIFFDISNLNFTINITSPPVLNLTVLIEGFYNPITDLMTRDSIRVYLRNIFAPFTIVDSGKVFLSTSGTGSIVFPNAVNGVNYYIQLKHRNSIETWSNLPGQSFTASVLNYDFTTSSSQAFGNNMKQVDASPIRFAIYSGDVNQDGIIDASDLSNVDNDAFNSVSGYVNTDVNGDDFVDASDLSIVDNNSFSGVLVRNPIVGDVTSK